MKSILNNRGMITTESLIVFPLTLMISLIFFSYLILEFEKSHIVLRANQIIINPFTLTESYEDRNLIEVKISESPLTRSVSVNYELDFTSDIIPSRKGLGISYKGGFTDYKKLNILALKGSINDGFLDESLSPNGLLDKESLIEKKSVKDNLESDSLADKALASKGLGDDQWI